MLMIKYLLAIILVCFFICPGAVIASDLEKSSTVNRLIGSFAPKTGAWSEYALFDMTTGIRTVMRMSIVGVESDSYWYEVITKEGQESKIVKMMITGDPNDPENIKRLIVKSGQAKAQEMDRDSLQKIRVLAGRTFEEQSGIPAGPNVSMKDIETGAGVATVPAGTFDVSLHQIVDRAGTVYAEYKYSEDIRPFGIVSSESENTVMVLIGHGEGAKSLITEEPVMMRSQTAESEDTFKEREPGTVPQQSMGLKPGSNIRQIPAMGTGYEPKQQN